MSRAALLEPLAPADAPGADSPPDGEQPTLGDLVASAWEGLLAGGRATCPVCAGPMVLHGGAGRCEGCGSALS